MFIRVEFTEWIINSESDKRVPILMEIRRGLRMLKMLHLMKSGKNVKIIILLLLLPLN